MVTIDSIRRAGLFSTLSDAELEKIAKLGTNANIAIGQSLISESDVGQTMYLIVEGRVDVSVAIPGSNSHEPIATLKDGEVVGEMILLGRERRSAQVTAKDAVKAIVWKREDMVGLFEKDNVIGFKVMRQLASLLADRLISTNLVLRNVLTVPRTIFM